MRADEISESLRDWFGKGKKGGAGGPITTDETSFSWDKD